MADPRRTLQQLRRAVLRRRRVVAATLAAGAVLLTAQVAAPTPAPLVPVVVAAHDLTGGSTVATADLRVSQMTPELVPDGSPSRVEAVVGQTLAGPMRTGEVLTDRRIVGPALVAGYGRGLVVVPIRISDPDVVSLLRVGDHIDVYAARGDGPAATRVVTNAPVVTLPQVDDDSAEGALVALAVSSADAALLAQAGASSALSISLR